MEYAKLLSELNCEEGHKLTKFWFGRVQIKIIGKLLRRKGKFCTNQTKEGKERERTGNKEKVYTEWGGKLLNILYRRQNIFELEEEDGKKLFAGFSNCVEKIERGICEGKNTLSPLSGGRGTGMDIWYAFCEG